MVLARRRETPGSKVISRRTRTGVAELLRWYRVGPHWVMCEHQKKMGFAHLGAWVGLFLLEQSMQVWPSADVRVACTVPKFLNCPERGSSATAKMSRRSAGGHASTKISSSFVAGAIGAAFESLGEGSREIEMEEESSADVA